MGSASSQNSERHEEAFVLAAQYDMEAIALAIDYLRLKEQLEAQREMLILAENILRQYASGVPLISLRHRIKDLLDSNPATSSERSVERRPPAHSGSAPESSPASGSPFPRPRMVEIGADESNQDSEPKEGA